MLRDDDHWLAVTDAFYSAALSRQGWYQALEGFAEATGSANGELIGLGANAAVPFNIFTNIDPAFVTDFVAAGGGDPALNPRVNAGMKASPLKVLSEADFITPEEHRRHPHYQEFAFKWDIPYSCLTTLERTDDLLIGLAVGRNKAQGHITAQQKQVFQSIAPHVRAAVRMQIALEGEGAALLAGALDSMSMPAFICDRTGTVRNMTPAAERLLEDGRGLQLRVGQLGAINPGDDRALHAAISNALQGRAAGAAPAVQTVIVRKEFATLPVLVLDVIALPQRQFELGFAPRVLVLARGERNDDSRRSMILRAAYGLTAAETEIAVKLADGRAPEAIAQARGVSLATVRFQIKSILAKAGVKRQVELASLIGRL